MSTIRKLLESIDQIQGGQMNEDGDEYADSAEFTEDFFGVDNSLAAITGITTSQKWNNWLRVTDHNYLTHCVDSNERFRKKLNAAIAAFDILINEIEKAE